MIFEYEISMRSESYMWFGVYSDTTDSQSVSKAQWSIFKRMSLLFSFYCHLGCSVLYSLLNWRNTLSQIFKNSLSFKYIVFKANISFTYSWCDLFCSKETSTETYDQSMCKNKSIKWIGNPILYVLHLFCRVSNSFMRICK